MGSSVVGVLATFLSVGQVLRQVVDLSRAQSVMGVSPVTWSFGLVQSAAIGTFSTMLALWEAAAANAFIGILCAFVLVLLGRARSEKRWLTVGCIAVAGPILLGTLVDPEAAGLLGAFASFILWLPQAFRSIRTRSAEGLSVEMLALGLASSALWLAYSVAVGELALAVPPTSALVSLSLTWLFSKPGRARGDLGAA